MPTLQEMFQSREYQTSNREQQREMYSLSDKGFAGLSRKDQDLILGEIEDEYGRKWWEGSFWDAVGRGASGSASHFAHTARMGIDLLQPDSIREAAGADTESDLEKYLKEFEEQAAISSENPEGKNTWMEIAGEAIGSTLVAVPTYAGIIAAGTAGLTAAGVSAPVAGAISAVGLAGFGMGALSKADQGWLESLKAGTLDAAFFALFPGLKAAGASRPMSALVLGNTAFMMTPEEMDIEERLGHGLTMAILGAGQRPGMRPSQRRAFLEVEQQAKLKAEEAATEVLEQRGYEVREREQIANDRLELPKDKQKAAELERKIEDLPPEERQMMEEIRAAEKNAEAETLAGVEERIKSLKLQRARVTDPKQRGFIDEEINFLTREMGAQVKPKPEPPKPKKSPVQYDTGDFIVRRMSKTSNIWSVLRKGPDGKPDKSGPMESFNSLEEAKRRVYDIYNERERVSLPRGEEGSQGDLPAKTTRERTTPPEPPRLGQGKEREPGFYGEWETFSGEFESRFGKMGEYPDKQLPPGGGEGGGAGGGGGEGGAIGAGRTPREPYRSTKGDRRRLEYVDDGHGALWMMRKAGIEDMPDNVYHKFKNLRGIPNMQDGMVRWGAVGWVPDPKVPGRRIINFVETPAYDVTPRQATMTTPDGRSQTVTTYEATESPTRTHKGAGDIILPILGKGKKYEADSWDYFQARQSNELITQTIDPYTNRIRPATPQEIAEAKTREKNWDLDKIEEGLAKADPTRVAVYEAMKAFQRKMADFYVDSGFITRDQVNNWMRKEYAFSYMRNMEVGRSGRHRTVDSLAAKFGVHRLHGSKRDLRDRYTNWITGPQDLARAALQNKWEIETVDKALALGGFAERVSPSAERIQVSRTNLRRALIDEMMNHEGLTEAQAQARMRWIGELPGDLERLAFFIGANKPYGSDIISIVRRGKPEYYRVYDPVLLRTFESINRHATEGIAGRWMRAFKAFKQGAITLDPSFIASNGVRDPLMATVMGRTGQQHITAAVNGLMHTIRRSPEYRELIANGLGGASMRDGIRVTRRRLVKAAQRANRKWFNPRNLLLGPGDMYRFLHELGRAIEMGPRVGEALRARKSGVKGPRKGSAATMEESVFAGREVSTDFATRGGGKPTEFDGIFGKQWGPEANQFLVNTVPFYNAMLASTDRFYRALFRDPNGKLGTGLKTGMVGITSMLLYGINRWLSEKYGHLKDEDGRTMVDFLNLPDWARQTAWHFYVPTKFDENFEPSAFDHYHMPKLWEVGMLGSLAERFAESMMDGPDEDKSLFLDSLNIVAHNFNFKTEGEGIPVPLPAGIDIITEQAMNRILFTGQPIETRGMGEVEPWLRSRSRTPRVLQEFSIGLRNQDWVPDTIRSPARAEALLRGIFGNWASIGMQVTDQVFFPGGPALGWDDVPVVRRFYSEAGKYDLNTELYYRNLEKFNQAAGNLRELAKRGEEKLFEEEYLDPDQQLMVQMAPGFDRANRRLQLYNREIDMVKRGIAEPFASPKEKRRIINRLEADRNAIMKSMNEMYEFMRKQQKQMERR